MSQCTAGADGHPYATRGFHGTTRSEGTEGSQHGVESIAHLSQGESAMNLNAHRLWAGTALVLATTALQVTTIDVWSLALITVLGIMLVLTSFTPEGKRT